MKSNQFTIHRKDTLTYLTIPAFDDTGLVRNVFSTRLGGISEGIYESMNLGFNTQDSKENIKKNYQILCDHVGIDIKDLVLSDQIHEDQILIVDEMDRGKGINKEMDYTGIDGLITNKPGVALVTVYADCVPLFFLDPVNKVIGLAHAGWRGTVKQIGLKIVQRMKTVFGSSPENILAAIGPSIGSCCFEVSEDVKLEVEKIFKHDIIEKIVRSMNSGKYMVDLWTANEMILLEAGLQKNHITKTDLCTMCHKDTFFSHRGTHGKRGSLAAILELK